MTSIAVMNAKGGVGKSTLTMAIAEHLSVLHGKRILLVDADGQMSLSLMVAPVTEVMRLGDRKQNLGGWLSGLLPGAAPTAWQACASGPVSDIDDARDIYLIAGDMDLTLIERELVAANAIAALRAGVRNFLAEAREYVDFVLIDCAPGISVVTEVFLREAQWHLVPVKPDVLAVSGMKYLQRFKRRDASLGFAAHLGIVINMVQSAAANDLAICDLLMSDPDLACFAAAVPHIGHLQKAALFVREKRSLQNKYPAESGKAIRSIVQEVLSRTAHLPTPTRTG